MSHSIFSPLARFTRQIAGPAAAGYLLFASCLSPMAMAQDDQPSASSPRQAPSEAVQNTGKELSLPQESWWFQLVAQALKTGGVLNIIVSGIMILWIGSSFLAQVNNYRLTDKLNQLSNNLNKINQDTK